MNVDPGEMRRVLDAHFELFTRGHDEPDLKHEWLRLFRDDCVTEEPVGSQRRRGIQSEGWDMTHGERRRLWLEPLAIIPSGSTPEAVSVVRERLLVKGAQSKLIAVGVWRFDEDCRIAGSRIFVESDQLGPDSWAQLLDSDDDPGGASPP